MYKLIWPCLVVLGIVSVLVIDAGRGLDSLGLWLIPVGVIGGLITVLRNKQKRSRADSLLILVWALAFLSVAGIYFDIGPNKDEFGGGGFIWVLPALGLTITGTVLMFFRLIKQK